jgi:hypothetical protein
MTGLFHDPERGFDASKIHKTFFKSFFALVLMTGLFHDPERGFDASKIHKTFEKSFCFSSDDWIIS